MWLLASVNTLVDGQSRALNELFAAIWKVTDVRSYTAVDAF